MTQVNVKWISSKIGYWSYLLDTLLRVLSELQTVYVIVLQTNDAAGLCLEIELLLQVNGYYTLNYCSWVVFLNPLDDFVWFPQFIVWYEIHVYNYVWLISAYLLSIYKLAVWWRWCNRKKDIVFFFNEKFEGKLVYFS